MKDERRWVEALPTLGAVVGGLGLLILLIVMIIGMVAVKRFSQEEGLAVLGQIKPLLKSWMGWVSFGLAALSGGMVLYLAGHAHKKSYC